MLKAYELFGFMPPDLALQIVEDVYATDRELYRATLQAIAEARRLRPQFLERKPRPQRNQDIVQSLSRARQDLVASNLLRGWLMKNQTQLLIDFLDALGIAHENGVVEDLPESVEDARLDAAVEELLGKHPAPHVTVYLNAFNEMNEAHWPNLKQKLETDSRLQFA